MEDTLQFAPEFPMVVDLDQQQTKQYDRVTVYLIDKQGFVAQIFDGMLHGRPPWDAVLAEVRVLEDGVNARPTP